MLHSAGKRKEKLSIKHTKVLHSNWNAIQSVVDKTKKQILVLLKTLDGKTAADSLPSTFQFYIFDCILLHI